MNNNSKISIFGLGYVGCVSIGCLTKHHLPIIGVDNDENKLNLLHQGIPTIYEDGLDELINKAKRNELIEVTADPIYAINNSNIAIICVGTPTNEENNLDINNVLSVSKSIGQGLRKKNDFLIVILRSTVIPGTIRKVVKSIENNSGKKCGIDFNVFLMPEFLREGEAVHDFFNPPYLLIGYNDTTGMDKIENIFSMISAPIIKANIDEVEMIKLINNSFHALKVSFANEVGRVGQKLGIDSQLLMEIFTKDNLLNTSSKYLKPGLSFGGSCLPKDLSAIVSIAKDNSIDIPVINAIHYSNKIHDNYIFEIITSYEIIDIGIVGLSFKSKTDDTRNSSSLRLCRMLKEYGYNLKIYDRYIDLSKLIGQNKKNVYALIEDIEEIFVHDFRELINKSSIIVFMQKDRELIDFINNNHKEKIVIDTVGIRELNDLKNYRGICW
tara:strand:- start:184 stop:1503 length:1320 start_codon:yes stop_codon:yes gene_type:complete